MFRRQFGRHQFGVQVSASHAGDKINLVFHTIDVTVSSNATVRYETSG